MGIFACTLVAATFLCALVAGFLFAFAVVVMPGIKTLNDAEFVRAFQVMDRVIQNNQPAFILVWVGSAIALVAAMGLSFYDSDFVRQAPLLILGAFYLFLVQLPTIVINIPLNNKLQSFDVATLTEDDARQVRAEFEQRWNRSNIVRTVVACFVCFSLIVLTTQL